jgi:hypothetical protein
MGLGPDFSGFGPRARVLCPERQRTHPTHALSLYRMARFVDDPLLRPIERRLGWLVAARGQPSLVGPKG